VVIFTASTTLILNGSAQLLRTLGMTTLLDEYMGAAYCANAAITISRNIHHALLTRRAPERQRSMVAKK
jgi:hypothetical protein